MKVRTAIVLVIGLILVAGTPYSQRSQDQIRQEEADDLFKRWLDQDVLYIITDEERAVFSSLTTPEEKEAFIEQFWLRRDPDPESGINEFREEHYRRIAYANDHFSIGAPGWKTDRGRIYIIHGPPDTTEYFDQGEQYYRPLSEGGGVTTTYSWLRWTYRHILDIGSNVEVEFVDKTLSGHYVFARDEMDKDAMLWVPGLGLTEAERLGGATKAERIGTRTMANFATRRVGNPLKMFSQKDDLFERLRRYTHLQTAPGIKFTDLESIVDINLYYDNLSFDVRHDLIRVTSTDYLVPVTFFFDTKDFTFERSGGIRQATLNVYGRVENLSRHRIYHFDETVHLTLSDSQEGQPVSSRFQKNIPLGPGRYKLVAIVKDVKSGKIGTLERGLIVPNNTEEKLEMSPVILADRVQPAKFEEFITDPFVLGNVKVYPSKSERFERGNPLGFYFEVYNVMADQQSLEADLSMRIRLVKDGKEIDTPFANSDLRQLLHRFSDRFFAGSMLNTEPLEPGSYNLVISVTDQIAQETTEQTVPFQILSSSHRTG